MSNDYDEDWRDYVDPDEYVDPDAPTGEELLRAVKEYREWKARKEREELGEPELTEFFVHWYRLTTADIADFRAALNAATAESDLQQFLQQHPEILVQVLNGGHGRWSIPQKRLGSEHVTDFVIAEKSSIGFEWTAVELESPTAALFKKSGDLSTTLAHAVRQVMDWRDWLSRSADYAARPRSKGGLGLIDIDPQLPGLIIIGRRNTDDVSTRDRRRSLSRELRIRIHTYDWLADVSGGAAAYFDRPK